MSNGKEMFNEAQVTAELARNAAKTVSRYIERAEKIAPSPPDVEGALMVTVSVEWLAWMLQCFDNCSEAEF